MHCGLTRKPKSGEESIFPRTLARVFESINDRYDKYSPFADEILLKPIGFEKISSAGCEYVNKNSLPLSLHIR